ncbi:MAG: HDIG domain-containing protein [Prevotellaceae bacterium]|jgi:putative nucleotidyltransferase with HDIG domain|nr:HDIG domain-containing protein [Prevotellaceae bacterium]
MKKENKVYFSIKNLIYLLLFAATVLMVFKLIPYHTQFDLVYEQGKPWRHDLLTAPFDFPIYKSEVELSAEQDSMMRFFTPYYKINTQRVNEQITELRRNSALYADSALSVYVERTLKMLYKRGIIDIKNFETYLRQQIRTVAIIDAQSMVKMVNLSTLFTPRTAYDYLCSHSENRELLQSLDLNRYILENLTLDKVKSEQALNELHNHISLTAGLVQAGQRIIDRGEIVDGHTFKILNSYKRAMERETVPERNSKWALVGELLLITGILLLFALYLYLFRQKFISVRNIIFLMMMIVIMVSIISLVVRYTTLSIYIVPLTLMPIIVRIFLDSRTALFVHLITTMLIVFMTPNPFMFLIMQITAGMVAVSNLKQLKRRSQLVQVAGFVFLDYVVVYIGMTLIAEGGISHLQWEMFAYFVCNSLLLLFAYVLIFIFEKLFGYLSDVTLVELSDINSKLLMEFSNKAPGSFQHVLQVSNLAAEAAAKINANTLLARTGALYHDIGKLTNPMIFTENQLAGINPLSGKSYEEAAQIIIAHVAEGVRIAERARLPKQIIGFIRTHHARSVARYFYNSFRNDYPDQPVDMTKFTYPGPTPSTKEEAIVMMADAVEATSRSLKDYSEESIHKMVDIIIDGQIEERSFRNAPITFRDVERVKAVFRERLKNIYHSRISYPELKTSTTNTPVKGDTHENA